MAQKQGIEIDVALNSHKTFYAKKCQGNGYYPVFKYEWDDKEQKYRLFNQKTDRWVDWGCSDNNELKYKFKHNAYILSFNFMQDEEHYNEL